MNTRMLSITFAFLCLAHIFHAGSALAQESTPASTPAHTNAYTPAAALPKANDKTPSLDATYWPLTTAVGLASTVTGAQLGFLLGAAAASGSDVYPVGALVGGGTAGGAIGAAVGGLVLSNIANSMAHGTFDTDHLQTPILPAYAASIGSGIFWGSMLGVGLTTLTPNIASVFPIFGTAYGSFDVVSAIAYATVALGAAPLGGYVASLLPPPQTTAQVGLRNLGGTLGMVSGLTLSIPTGVWLNEHVSNDASIFALSGFLILPAVGLVAGDLVGQTNIYTDTDIFWTGAGAAAGAALGYGIGYLNNQRFADFSADANLATALLTNVGMYAGAGATLWGLASLHTAQPE